MGIQVDVSDPTSITVAASSVRNKLGGEKLYGLINNAGIAKGETDQIIKTNLYGPKLMSEAFIPMLDPANGCIVNSGAELGPMFVMKQKDKEIKAFLSSKEVT